MQNRTGTIFDLGITESLNGGEVQQSGNDLVCVFGNENQHYLAMFGGNVESNTPSLNTTSERLDYWGNSLIWNENSALQFNSNTERTLNTTALNSSGRLIIENAVKSDLDYLKAVATVTVNVLIASTNTVLINITAKYNDGKTTVTVITFQKRKQDGDFSPLDFNNDFY